MQIVLTLNIHIDRKRSFVNIEGNKTKSEKFCMIKRFKQNDEPELRVNDLSTHTWFEFKYILNSIELNRSRLIWYLHILMLILLEIKMKLFSS